MSSTEPLCLELEFARAVEAGDPHGFRFAPQDYLLRGPGGSIDSASFPWTPQLLSDLDALRRPGRDPALVQSIGETLRRFLALLGWARQEAQIQEALSSGRRVLLTIRSSAAELYALPWELLTIRSTGQALGALPGVVIRYEWPQTSTAAEPGPRSENERILLAWSAAGGAVPAAEQLRAVLDAAQKGFYPFDPARDVLEHVSSRRLSRALEAASQEHRPIAVLHLLCHGQAVGSTFGLCMDADEDNATSVVVDAGRLRQLLTPHAGTLRLVVLCACDSGNSGALGNQLGSVAQALHRAGIATVVASRYPLSSAGSIRLCEALYETLLLQLDSLESALVLARQRLAEDATQMDWASLQIYARAADGDDTRPVVFRPYRGLLAFQPEHQRFLFGRETEISGTIGSLEALVKAGKPRFLIVAGASGTGKSSVVLAGVVPRLLQGPKPPRLVRLRPSSLLRDAVLEGGAPADPLEAALSSAEAARPLLVVVDQFEEVFTHASEGSASQALVRRLWALARDPGSQVSVIVTLRVDFIGRCGELILDDSGRRLDSVAYDDAQRIFVGQLDRASLRAGIELPARRVGLRLAEGLTDALLDAVGAEPGALPLLQDTLDLLWQRRKGNTLTQADYVQLGGVLGALSRRADALIDSLDPAEQKVARRLLIKVCRAQDSQTVGNTRQRVEVARLRPQQPAQAVYFDRMLARLVGERLLVTDGRGEQQLVEVAHEALLRRWERLLGWVRADLKRLLDLEKLEVWVAQRAEVQSLLTDAQIAYAEDVLSRDPEEFPEAAHRLLQESKAHRLRQRWLWRGLFGAAMVAAALSAGFGLAAARARDHARLAEQRANAEAEQLHQQLLASHVEKGRQELILREPLRAALWLHKAYAERSQEKMTPYLLAASLQPIDTLLFDLRGHEDRVEAVRVSVDGRRVLTGSKDGTARLWDAHTGRLLAKLSEHRGPVLDAAFSADGRLAITGGADFSARVWDLPSGSEIAVLEHEREVVSVEFSKDGRRILTAAYRSSARIWDAHSGRKLMELARADGEGADKEAILSARFSPDGQRILTANTNGAAHLFDVSRGRRLAVLKTGAEADILETAFSPDGLRIALCGEDGDCQVWDAQHLTQLAVLRGHSERPAGVVFSPDGQRIIVANEQGTARVWNAHSGEPIGTLQGQRKALGGVVFSPDGRLIATASQDGSVWLWQADNLHLLSELRAHTAGLSALTFSPDGKQLLAGSEDGTTRVWRVGGGLVVAELSLPRDASAAFSADGRHVLITAADGSQRRFRADDGSLAPEQGPQAPQVAESTEPTPWVHGYESRLSPPAARAITIVRSTGRRNYVELWDTASGRLIKSMDPSGYDRRRPSGDPQIRSIAFSADGRAFLAAGSGNKVDLWDSKDGHALASLGDHPEHVTSAVFSPDGQLVLTTCMDGVARLFWVRGELFTQMQGSAASLASGAFSPDGLRIVTAGYDGIARIWEVKHGRLLQELQGHSAALTSAVFSPDGRRVLTASGDNTARIWNTRPEDRPAAALGRLLRCHLSIALKDQLIVSQVPHEEDCQGVGSISSP